MLCLGGQAQIDRTGDEMGGRARWLNTMEAAIDRMASGRRRRVTVPGVAAEEGLASLDTTRVCGSTSQADAKRPRRPMTRFHRRSLLAARQQIVEVAKGIDSPRRGLR